MKTKYVWGLGMIAFGVLVLLKSFGIIEKFDFWELLLPVVLMGAGLTQMFENRRVSVGGAIIFLVGLSMLISSGGWFGKINVWQVTFGGFLVYFGVTVFFRGSAAGEQHARGGKTVNITAIFNGSELRCVSEEYESGDILAVFGGVELDFTGARAKNDISYLDVTMVFGGATIMVPPYWRVECTVAPVFGGVEDKTRSLPEAEAVLRIGGQVLFGGLEIKNP